jgi:Phospholipase_D-nuclease N-terminal
MRTETNIIRNTIVALVLGFVAYAVAARWFGNDVAIWALAWIPLLTAYGVLGRRDPSQCRLARQDQSKVAWILAQVVVPGIGSVVYFSSVHRTLKDAPPDRVAD